MTKVAAIESDIITSSEKPMISSEFTKFNLIGHVIQRIMSNEISVYDDEDGAEVVLAEPGTGEALAWHFKGMRPALRFVSRMRKVLDTSTGSVTKINLPRHRRVSH